LADYREHYLEIRAAAASVVAVSVDAPEESEALRAHLSLPFPILCDTERYVVRHWDIYNPREKGGIAKPAVFIIDQDRVVRYAAVDTVMRRVAAAEIVCLLQAADGAPPVRRRVLVPLLSNWLGAIRNSIRR
jgi:peroxiredoxin